MKTPISYYGGKQNMIPHLLRLIHPHSQYVEPFCGGASLLFAKPKSKNEVINDIDGRITTFWRGLKTDYPALKKLIDATPHAETLHEKAAFIIDNMFMFDDVQIAWAVWVQTNMSFSGQIQAGFAFSNSGEANRTKNKRHRFDQSVANRLATVEIFNRNALDLIKLKDGPDTFFYLDPPYAESDCGHYEKLKQVYYELLDLLPTIKGKFLLSSYPSELLDNLRNKWGWSHNDIIQNLSVSGKNSKGKTKTECLTFNFEPPQQSLF